MLSISMPGTSGDFVRWMIWLQWRFGSHLPLLTDGCGYDESADDYLAVYGLHREYFGMHSFTARYPGDVPYSASRRLPWENVPDRGGHGVKRGARRHPGRGVGGGRPPVPPAPQRPNNG
ncbi:hypothetical protein M9H77_07387 [Catharanthus roseus]|uniref:Uncharacterized protein n=1 Tax=Catharanthus roseus TaxID=4058 RepID=A0ACC0BV18_CATRO|nr:hypothetical protein M9H77_07387 [Catharanthus roseus]